MESHNKTYADFNLVLLTNHFPFGHGESFLETEFPYLKVSFNKVLIITKNTNSEIRPGFKSVNCHRVSPVTKVSGILTTILFAIRCFHRVVGTIWSELISTKESWSIKKLKTMFHDLFKAVERASIINSIIKIEKLGDDTVFYGYWLDSAALALTFLPSYRRSVKVARAHGGDVYAYRNDMNYLSFRRSLLSQLDQVFTISEDGRNYLLEQNGAQYANKITVSHLGTRPQKQMMPDLNPPFTIVSCSSLLKVKRIELLIEALSFVKVPVRWIHIGDGPLRKQLEDRAQESLSGRSAITFNFVGHFSTKELMAFYINTDVHLFINVSSSEGIPVTIMEAQSFGIPAIGPRVGGVPEIISDSTGALIDKDANAPSIATTIERLLTQPAAAYAAMRANSYQNWLTKFNAERNFPTFIHQITSLKPNGS